MDRITDGRTLAQALVDTVRESLLVLDGDLRVVSASRSFYTTFKTTPAERRGVWCMTWAPANGTIRRFANCLSGLSRTWRHGPF